MGNSKFNFFKGNPQAKGWFGSILVHLIIFIVLAVTGILTFTPLKQTDIVEVTAVGGGSAGSSSSASVNDAPVTPEQLGADAILQHSDKAKVKISYDELKKLEPEPTPQENNTPTANNISNNHPANNPNPSNGNNNGANSGNNNAPGNGPNPGKGDGAGSGDNKGNDSGPGVDPNALHQDGQLDVRPRVIRDAVPNYPEDLVEDGVTGTTYLSIIISTSGAVESVSVSRSSGNRRLDMEAKKAAQKMVFSPGKIKNIPVRCMINKPIRFNIK